MFEILKHLLTGQNQFASGGLLLMIIGSVGVALRALPLHLWSWLVEQTTMSITVKDDDASFQWVKEWFLEQTFMKQVRRVDLDTSLRGTELALIPAPGTHLFWHDRRPFLVRFYRSDDTKGKSQRRIESLIFQTPGRQQLFLKHFVHEIVACHHSKAGTASSLYVFDDYWSCVQAYAPRLLASVILKPGEKEHLIEDLQRFRASRERYRRIGVPFHRGYLFYGPPGTGKTSLVSALASHFGMSIYVVNLSGFNDRSLKTAIHDVPHNSVILFEDIDCMKAGNRRPDSGFPSNHGEPGNSVPPINLKNVTLSGLLNVLDGFHAPDNVVFVMTTNDVEALDPALLRPGRIDYKLLLGPASESQKLELYRRFFPEIQEADARRFIQRNRTQTMAEFQGSLLELEQTGPASPEPRHVIESPDFDLLAR